MGSEAFMLIAAAVVVYLLVLSAHAVRHRFGLAYFYALLGGLTVIMSWVTDAGIVVQVSGVMFVVGSTVFYTSLLLGVFVIYVFEGPVAARTAILIVAVLSVLTPLSAASMHLLADLTGSVLPVAVPRPSLRINTASVVTTLIDLVFLAISWEFLGKTNINRWLRIYLTLLGVMWLDVLLFATGAFAGTSAYLSIMQGTFVSRLFISLLALPFLATYLNWQSRRTGIHIEKRPVLAILQRVAEMEDELADAQLEIELREIAAGERDDTIEQLRRALAEVRTLRGLLPICSRCKRIRDDRGYWNQIEQYIQRYLDAQFTHGICPDCARELYPDVDNRTTPASDPNGEEERPSNGNAVKT